MVPFWASISTSFPEVRVSTGIHFHAVGGPLVVGEDARGRPRFHAQQDGAGILQLNSERYWDSL